MAELPGYGESPDLVYGITDFVGFFFSCGLAGGSAFHFVKGIRDSAKGARLAGAVQVVRANSLRVAGNFGAYCTAFSAIETAVSSARGKEDMWSSVAASAATWGLHGMRRGRAPAAARCALLGVMGVFVMTGAAYVASNYDPRCVSSEIIALQKRMMRIYASSSEPVTSIRH